MSGTKRRDSGIYFHILTEKKESKTEIQYQLSEQISKESNIRVRQTDRKTEKNREKVMINIICLIGPDRPLGIIVCWGQTQAAATP